MGLTNVVVQVLAGGREDRGQPGIQRSWGLLPRNRRSRPAVWCAGLTHGICEGEPYSVFDRKGDDAAAYKLGVEVQVI